jgi:cyclopropane-fatty-acyl-phospholipid synthase
MTRRRRLAPSEIDVDAGFHYDFSNEFYALWLDPSMTYSCAWFPTGTESLEEGQAAKLDLAFRKVDLKPRHRLLDIGCGWGAAAARAAERYQADAVGLTLSANQFAYAQGRRRPDLALDYHLQSWETYSAPADRIVSFGAFEHFTSPKYPAFFTKCRELLPADGKLLVQSITIGRPSNSMALRRFAYFLLTELVRGWAELPTPEAVVTQARLNGFELLHVESLRPHYVRTISFWLEALVARRDEAVAATSVETYDKFVRYLEGSARYHESGETSVFQFLFGVA